MFSHGMREARESEITIPDVRYETFLAVIRFLYSDIEEVLLDSVCRCCVSKCVHCLSVQVDLDSALEMLKLANMWSLPRLSAFIEQQVANHIDPETVCAVFQVRASSRSRLCLSLSLLFSSECVCVCGLRACVSVQEADTYTCAALRDQCKDYSLPTAAA